MKFPAELLRQCWFLAGPTASGKTLLGIELARRLGGEIVSMDSMAIYRGMEIGTAKPSLEERATVPHHLIDIAEPHEEFSTAQYLKDALSVCREILGRSRVPIFVGGTGLYLRTVLRGVFEGPPADWDYRRRLEEQARTQPPNWLSQELAGVDPLTAQRLHPNDKRRIIRALEVHHLTGRPASDWHREEPLPIEERPRAVLWLDPPRDWLYERIDRRVDNMLEQGLEAEVRQLLAADRPLGRTARQALGYRELIDWIEGRCPSLEAARHLIQTHSRQFAKRQRTWFRNLEECHPVPLSGQESLQELAECVEAAGRGRN
jgi:tRNA dimethylallyltransferase